MSFLRALGYVLAAAAILFIVFFLGVIAVIATFGIGVTRSDLFGLAPTLYLLLIFPFAALLAHLRAAHIKRIKSE